MGLERAGRPEHEDDDDQQRRDDDPRITAMRDSGTERVVTHAATVPVDPRGSANAVAADIAGQSASDALRSAAMVDSLMVRLVVQRK